MELKATIMKQLAFIHERFQAISENQQHFKAIVVEEGMKKSDLPLEQLEQLAEKELQSFYVALSNVGQVFHKCSFPLEEAEKGLMELKAEADFAKAAAEMLDAVLDLEAEALEDLEKLVITLAHSGNQEQANQTKLEMELLKEFVKCVEALTTEISLFIEIEEYLNVI